MRREEGTRRAATEIAFALVAGVVFLYLQLLGHDFVRFDDFGYIVDNPEVRDGLTWHGVRWAFTSFHMANWHPLTWVSHMADCELFGLAPGGHHLVSVVIHGVNAALLFLALRLMTASVAPSFTVAALFAFHPLRVESVAWASERKDVLAGLFFMLALLAYAHYARRPTPARYVLVFTALALGLMAKPMLVTLPLVLLLLDLWPLGRLGARGPAGRAALRAALLEKLPLLALCVASAAITVVAQHRGGAVVELAAVPLPGRVANALVASVTYLSKTVWPARLAFYYPYPAPGPGVAAALAIAGVLGAMALASVTFLAAMQAGRRPYLLVGWLWYLIMLLPVIGLVQVGHQSMADRYTYLPLIGITIAVVWSAAEVAARRPSLRRPLVAAGTVIVVLLSAATWLQARHWRDSRALFEHALAVTHDNYFVHNNLGNLLAREGDLEGAAAQFEQALSIRPDFTEAMNNLGSVAARAGDHDRARSLYEQAIALRPDYAKAHYNLALSLEALGRLDQAEHHYLLAMQHDANLFEAHERLGDLAARRGDFREAVSRFRAAIEGNPDLDEAACQLASILATCPDPAIRDDDQARRWAERCERRRAEPPRP